MSKEGNKIPDLSVERDPKAIKRLTAAREYLAGLSQDDIEEKYGWSRQTVSLLPERVERPLSERHKTVTFCMI